MLDHYNMSDFMKLRDVSAQPASRCPKIHVEKHEEADNKIIIKDLDKKDARTADVSPFSYAAVEKNIHPGAGI
ncbi:hypothetical protein VTN96DRAFT_5870 [Rasamsonia emersonii]